MKSLDPWATIWLDEAGDIVWPRPQYGNSLYQEVPSWIHYRDDGTRRLLFDGAFVGAEVPSGRGTARSSNARETMTMMRPSMYAGYYLGAEAPQTAPSATLAIPVPGVPSIPPAGSVEARKGLLAEVAPYVAPATGPIMVKKEFDKRQVLHVEICIDDKCYRTSMDLGPAIAMVMERLAQWHKDQHAPSEQALNGQGLDGQAPSGQVSAPAVVGAVENAVDAAGDEMVYTLVCKHVHLMVAGFFDDAGSSIGETFRALAPVISAVATSVATYYGGTDVGTAAGQLVPVVTSLQANLLDPKGDSAQKAAAQQSLQRVNEVAQSDPRAAQALAAAHQAVKDTAIAYHVKSTVDKAAAGDPAAQKDVIAIVQAAEKGDPAAKSTYEVIAQVLVDKAQHSEWGQKLWQRIMGSNSTIVRAGWCPPPVGQYFDAGYDGYPVYGGYSAPVAVGGFWDSLGSGVLNVYRTVSTPVTWFHKKVNQTLEDNPQLKQLVVTAASSVASAYGGPAAGKAVSEFGPAIISSSAETGGDPTMLFEDTKKKAAKASGNDPQVAEAITHAQNAVTQTMAVATLDKIAEDAARGDPEAVRQLNEIQARAKAGDQIAMRAMTVIADAQQLKQAAKVAQGSSPGQPAASPGQPAASPGQSLAPGQPVPGSAAPGRSPGQPSQVGWWAPQGWGPAYYGQPW